MIDPAVLWLFSFIGIVAGLIIGLVPGLGVSSTFLLLSPFLVSVDPVYSLFFFVALLVTSQYFGSITAMVFGIPGELSSFPIIKERSTLLDQLNAVLKQTAFGSFIGAIFALVVFLILLNAGSLWVYLYNYKIFSWVLGLAVVAIVVYGSKQNGILSNALLFASGILLARIGYDHQLGQSWGMFGIAELATGVPLAAVAMGLLVIPALFHTVNNSNMFLPIQQSIVNASQQWGSVIRGSVLGTVGGLVPGVTYMASTQLSYFIENWINKNSNDRPLKSVVATSTADNAGAVSSLYPLLWLGIPISLGEAMLIWLFDKHNQTLNLTTLSQNAGDYPLYWYLLGCFVLVNLIAYLLSWPGRRIAIWIAQKLLNRTAGYFIIVLVLLSLYFLAQESYSTGVFYITFILCSLVGIVVRRVEWMPLIMGLILGDTITLTLFKLGVLSI
jgi:putative tricarboxylic transport membrane protein